MRRPRPVWGPARKGTASLDVVICLAGALPVAFALYLATQYILAMFFGHGVRVVTWHSGEYRNDGGRGLSRPRP